MKIITRPIDKKENYIKRCVAVPGDVLEIKDARVYINGQPNQLYPHSKLTYMVKTKNGTPPALEDNLEMMQMIAPGVYLYNLENVQADPGEARIQCCFCRRMDTSPGRRTHLLSLQNGFSAGYGQL
jgi:signal peptidase I